MPSLTVVHYPLPLYVVPQKQLTEWSKAAPNDLHCPPPGTEPDLKDGVQDQVTISKQLEHKEMKGEDGWLCYGLTYATTCHEGFFWNAEASNSIKRHMVTENSCREELQKISEGESAPPTYPEPQCVWNSDNTVVSNYVLIVDHHVQFDPYTSQFVDGLFPNTRCRSSPCQTVHENTIWIAKESRNRVCSEFKNETAIIMRERDKSQDQTLWLRMDDYDFVDIDQACKMVYCGRQGLKLPTGVFILWWDDLRKWEECPSQEQQIDVETQLTIELKNKENFRNAERRMECLTTLIGLRNGMPLTYLALDQFQPDNPGAHMVYRINNGVLEKSRWLYWPIVTFSLAEKNVLGYDADRSAVMWTHWVPSGLNGTESGFNGIYRRPDGIMVVPRIELRKARYSEILLLSHAYITVEHPEATQLKSTNLDSDVRFSISRSTTDIGSWIEHMWDSFKGKIVIIVVCVTLVVLLVGICCCCGPACCSCLLSCCKSCRESTTPVSRTRDMEMQGYSPGRPSAVREAPQLSREW